jgi:hypothetical protein
MLVTPAVPYLSTGLAGCPVEPGNSRGARKLDRTPRIIKKNKKKALRVLHSSEGIHACSRVPMPC